MTASQDKNLGSISACFLSKQNNKYHFRISLLNSGSWQRVFEVAAVHAGGSPPF